jgi:hypothetical protein
VLAVRSAIERLVPLAQALRGWRPVLLFGQAKLCELQGEHERARAYIEDGFAHAPVLQHWMWKLLATQHVVVLTALGRIEEAIALGRQYLELSAREQLMPRYSGPSLALGAALARSGAMAEAVSLIDDVIAEAEHEGREGLALGTAWESRARIALVMRDAGAFELAFQRCTQIFGRHKNPVLMARLARLVDEASSAKTLSLGALASAEQLSSEATSSQYETIYSRMRECVDPDDRARCALTILLQHVESFAGYLYGVDQQGLRLLSGLPEPLPEPELDSWVRDWTAAELGGEDVTERDAQGSGESSLPLHYTDRDGRAFEAIVLSQIEDGQEHVAAILVWHADRTTRGPIERQLFSRMAATLLEQDVSGVVLEQRGTVTS